MSTSHIARVVLWMTGALLSFSVMALSIRGLAGALSIFEILTVRTVGAVLILLTLALFRPEFRPELKPRRMGLNFVRSTVHFASQYCWALSLLLLPLATVFALEFTMPVWLAIIAVLALGEKMTVSRAAVVILGFTGVLVILRPGLEAFQPASLLVLLASFGYAVFNALTKKMTATEPTFAIVFWMNAIQAPMGLLGSDPFFAWKLDIVHVPSVIGAAVAGLSAHYCLTNALRAGDATLVMPIDFLRVPLIALVGWWFYSEQLDIFVFIGGAIMLTGIVWNLRSEAKRAQPRPQAEAAARAH